MRVWFRKIHCPSFICFLCKPPQHHLFAPPAFQSDHSKNHQLPRASTAAVVASGHLATVDEDDERKSGSCGELVLRSCIKRKAVEEGGKKTVQWMDVAGKGLVHVKEFETSESEDTDSESEYNRGCTCTIL